MRCPSSFELKRNVRSCRVLIVTGVLAILSGLALGMVANWPSSVAVGVRVDGIVESVSHDEQKGSVLNQLRFYPTASVEYDGRAERIVIPEFYVDRPLAEAEIGKMREVRVDKETLKPAADRPFQPLFLLPVFLGMTEICGGIVRLYRYSDYRRLDNLMRNERRPSVLRRGAG